MFISDLDGTLTTRSGIIPERTIESLRGLGRDGVPRVIATGRSWWGVNRLLPLDFPVDYLVCSSGYSIYDWKKRELLRSVDLTGAMVAEIGAILVSERVSFMLHDVVPENHRFQVFEGALVSRDFATRSMRGKDISQRRVYGHPDPRPGSEFVVIEEAGAALPRWLTRVASYSVVRATSPLDHQSMWFEIFAAGVSKGAGLDWLAQKLNIESAKCLAIGNDYNDLSMLEWAGHPICVKNSPPDLLARFPQVSNSEDGGIGDAIRAWQSR